MFLAITALHNEVEVGDMNFDIASYPMFKDQPQAGPQPYPIFWYVTSMSEHKDDAFEAIAYLTSEEFQLKNVRKGVFLSTLADKSIREQFGAETVLYKGKNVKALQPSVYSPMGRFTPYNTLVSVELNTGIRESITNRKDTNTLLREAAERANKKIQEKETAAGKK